jgi:flagellar basal-body rod modification protein FlgD
MMSTSAVNGASAATSYATTAAAGGSEMDTGTFMQILLAQMSHQNPLEPLNDKDMMAQMTQLNSLMELQKINGSLEKLLALGMLTEGTPA